MQMYALAAAEIETAINGFFHSAKITATAAPTVDGIIEPADVNTAGTVIAAITAYGIYSKISLINGDFIFFLKIVSGTTLII